mmetsp:Transcript_57614/g.160517  ORF Transcript_57614/g.160517 Transcript_57614/m.160517 type:complete len:351 (-) Transcript_57614:89-1141(-)
MSIDAHAFYKTYHGHDVGLLQVAHDQLREIHGSVIFLAGDSSLDNKFWFSRREGALNGYESILRPPQMKADVCYWLNKEAQDRGARHVCCLNTAIEATSLNDRAFCALLEQDKFIRDNISSEDYLVVSVGGNDIALTPLLCTVLNLAALVCGSPQACIEHYACAHPINSHVDLGCLGCGLPGCLTGFLCGWPLGMGYFVDLFKNRVENYVRRLVGDKKPKKVVVCMIYYLDEKATGSWADGALCCMCYNCNPGKLQAAIRKVFELATKRIEIPGTEVVAFPLFEVLDGKTSSDYIQRVEPSPTGSAKMAAALMDAILDSKLLSEGEAGSWHSSRSDAEAESLAPSQDRMC